MNAEELAALCAAWGEECCQLFATGRSPEALAMLRCRLQLQNVLKGLTPLGDKK